MSTANQADRSEHALTRRARGGIGAFARRRAAASIPARGRAGNPGDFATAGAERACLHPDDASHRLRLGVGRYFVARTVVSLWQHRSWRAACVELPAGPIWRLRGLAAPA